MPQTDLIITQAHKEGLMELEAIIKNGQKLQFLATFGTFAVVFSSGFSIGTVIAIYDTDWQKVGAAAKAINTITRYKCQEHCVFMYLQTNDPFWDEMAKKFD
ncbi:MAG: hypothetical protein IPL33_11515 [Sphingobacteriales bacterium]|nr:hypothetical protein [Sphingobacteriales bacterium]MCC7222415.1 hypothetical protein [Chitinophagales bacterium]